MKKRTKIVATVGPSCDSLEKIEELIAAGVNVFRLNFSHGTYAYHAQMLSNIREAMKKSGLIVGVLQDISGPKIRIGDLKNSFDLRSGDILEFVKDDILGYMAKEGHYKLSLNQKEILDKLEVGQYIYLYDGIIRARVTKIKSNSVYATLENDGVLSSKKGINFPNTRINVEVLTSKDRADIEWGVKNGVDFMAISFVQNAQDILNARAIVEKNGGNQM
ncbi:MAG: pyruvate kinase, partial [Sulfurimonas sp.]|nr:pyruvate kinase [Sulfurimonas sp.]